MTLELAVLAATGELHYATENFGPFHNAHEAYGVLLEEVDELWDAVKLKPSPERNLMIKSEATQVAAMALRILVDLCDA